MSFRLSKKDQFRKTELLAYARERYMVICSHIDAFNTTLEAARQSLDEASRDYYESIIELQQFATGRGDEQESGFMGTSEQWRAGAQGAMTREWIRAYKAYKPDLPDIALPEDIEYPDDDLLSLFEELPDAP